MPQEVAHGVDAGVESEAKGGFMRIVGVIGLGVVWVGFTIWLLTAETAHCVYCGNWSCYRTAECLSDGCTCMTPPGGSGAGSCFGTGRGPAGWEAIP